MEVKKADVWNLSKCPDLSGLMSVSEVKRMGSAQQISGGSMGSSTNVVTHQCDMCDKV